MKRLFFALLCSACTYFAHSQILNTGLLNPNTFSNLNSIGTVSWSNAARAKTSNDSAATSYILLSALASANTHYITTSNFGYSLPLNAVVQGIQVTVKRKAQGLGVGSTIKDYRLSLIKGGTVLTANLGNTSAAWGTSYSTVTYGTDTSKWGTTWTADDINASNFGVAFASRMYAGIAGLGLTSLVDQIQTMVYYTVPSSPLPVKLVSFNGTVDDNNKIELNWETALEWNNDYFDIERSANAMDWETIGNVIGKGTSTTMQQYSYIDKTIAIGTWYYRLKQVDYDGAAKYSPVISIDIIANETETIEINYSTTGVVHISNITSATTLSIFNLNGNKLFENISLSNNSLNLASLNIPEGLYVLCAHSGSHTVSRKVYKPL